MKKLNRVRRKGEGTPQRVQSKKPEIASGRTSSYRSFHVKVSKVGQAANAPKLDAPESALAYWTAVIAKQDWFDENKEHVIALLLSVRYDILGYSLVSIGSLNEAITHPRECFRAAVASGAYAMILMHNHPSGDPIPSANDHWITQKMLSCAGLLEIELLDHVIVGTTDRYFSFQEAGGTRKLRVGGTQRAARKERRAEKPHKKTDYRSLLCALLGLGAKASVKQIDRAVSALEK